MFYDLHTSLQVVVDGYRIVDQTFCAKRVVRISIREDTFQKKM